VSADCFVDRQSIPAARSPPSRGVIFTVFDSAETADAWRVRSGAWRGRSAILLTMSKHPKPTAEPPTAPNRLTPQEIDELRENAPLDGRKNALVADGTEKAGGVEIEFAQCGGFPPVARLHFMMFGQRRYGQRMGEAPRRSATLSRAEGGDVVGAVECSTGDAGADRSWLRGKTEARDSAFIGFGMAAYSRTLRTSPG
jgi:hypothetical protein